MPARRAFALVLCASLFAPVFADGEEAKIGEKGPISGTVVDTAPSGDRTLRFDRPVSPSISGGGQQPTREVPQGEMRGTVGITIETDPPGKK